MFHLNSKAPDPAVWVRDVFKVEFWQKANTKTLSDLLGRRWGNSEEGHQKFLDLVIRARFPQFRTYPIKTIHFGEEERSPGLLPSLLIDGKSLIWQMEEQLDNGSPDRNPALTDCYFANNKVIQLSEEGLLTLFLEQDDTSVPLDDPVTVRIQLGLDGGVTDIKTLLQTRGAKVNPHAKLSVPQQQADMSVQHEDPAPSAPWVAGKDKKDGERSKPVAETRLQTGVGPNRQTTEKKAKPSTQTKVSSESAVVASDPHPGNAKQGASKSSKPKSDLKPTNVDSPPKEKAVVRREPSKSSTFQQAQEIVDASTTKASRKSNTGRDTSASLTPLPADEGPEVTLERSEGGDSRAAEMMSSATRRNPRTYGKSQAAKKVKTASRSGEKEDVSRDDVLPAHGSGKKRKAASESELGQEAKKPRTGKPLHPERLCWECDPLHSGDD